MQRRNVAGAQASTFHPRNVHTGGHTRPHACAYLAPLLSSLESPRPLAVAVQSRNTLCPSHHWLSRRSVAEDYGAEVFPLALTGAREKVCYARLHT